ncbi:NAD(P)-binding protein [Lophiostoma macrostomum CBS 122681]|uniref:NAD(P)-binding protein n=1 Tax=Lophiostoma macrostomum CBS 122681 TaxID=1314788 RepID=A0A6A6T5S9_9PLEO|nr:NAD(P)-binding protein [Lophiostoma macrostomum CBS 122681]
MPIEYTAESTASQIVDDYAHEAKGKTFLVTGVSPGGLGAVFAEKVAKAEPTLLILAGRNSSKVQQTTNSITSSYKSVGVRVLSLDLSSLAKARKAAEEVNGWSDVPNIDVLVNNAGVMATAYGKTDEGFETQFGTNHLAPFLFTNLIMGKLLASSAPRVVNVASDGHRLGPVRFDDYGFQKGENYNRWYSYGQSKTANMLFALSLAEKLGGKDLLAFSLHPGVIHTNLGDHLNFDSDFEELHAMDRAFGNPEGWKGFTFKTLDQGAATHAYAALSPELTEHNGAYLLDSRLADPWKDTVKPWGTSSIEAERLWQLSEKLVGQTFSY